MKQVVALTGRNTGSPSRDALPDELRCAAVECYRRRQTTTIDANEQNSRPTAPTLCVGGPVTSHGDSEPWE